MAHETKVQLRNLSRTGFWTEWLYSLRMGDLLWLKIPGIERLSATVVWIEGFTIGCSFERPLHPAVMQHIIARCGGREVDPDPPATRA